MNTYSTANKHIQAAKSSAPKSDDFWKVSKTIVSTGYCTKTYAYHDFENGVRLNQTFFSPSIFSMLYDKKIVPFSKYEVYTELFGFDDNDDSQDFIKLLKEKHPNVKSFEFGVPEIWSPDGEGDLIWCFEDENVEHAISFCKSLNNLIL
jgi:hypothetical protein